MAALLYTDKMDMSGPSRAASFKTERFQVDSYSIRAAKGLNPIEVKYTAVWNCLTQAEAKALADQLDATNGVELLQWTPPLENEELNYSVSGYSVGLDNASGSEYEYRLTANLVREYDN